MKILVIFGLMTAALYGVECENQITQAMKKNEVIPDVVSNGANQQLEVVYESTEILYPGYELTPTEVQNKPIEVNWYADDYSFYTLIFLSPDTPTRTNHRDSEIIKWLIVNIPGNDKNSGEMLVDYIGAGPPKDGGITRDMFFVYKQNGREDFDEKPIDKYSYEPRRKFSTRNFTQKHNMGPSIEAANFFLTRYDDYVPVLNDQLNCCRDL